mmetsp:Transcript_93177/g.199884  ORF Transcript_93177/g.199884 Transcript_93177/m.199884 type:complete len:261 (-) Transcript_93177:99-881(-)
MNPMMGMGMNPMMAAMQQGMNPMMAMAMRSGMNPMMMGMNPMMMAAMQGGMGNMAGSGDATVASQSLSATPEEPIDSRVRDLCRSYNIDDKTCRKLNKALNTREEFDSDMQALWMVMEKGVSANKKPMDIILVKIREIEKGEFAGKDLLDPDIKGFCDKYDLDDRVLNRLIKTMKMRGHKKTQDIKDLDARLGSAKAPAGLLVRLLEGLEESGKMPSPPRWLGGSGGAGRGARLAADARDRERERDRDRRRSRSRSKGRR